MHIENAKQIAAEYHVSRNSRKSRAKNAPNSNIAQVVLAHQTLRAYNQKPDAEDEQAALTASVLPLVVAPKTRRKPVKVVAKRPRLGKR